jgi:N-acetylmuramic acid 6-phosphate etherase
MIVVGLMSGTSADGVDATVVKILGVPPQLEWQVLSHVHVSYQTELRQAIFDCFDLRSGNAALICRLNVQLGEVFAQAALQAIDAAGLQPQDVQLIGSHGQTIWHQPQPETRATLQIGEAAVIAERTGIPVVSNFRPRDMAAGGQGAPLVAYVDMLLFSHPHKVRATQNIGGIANVTYLPALQKPVGEAFAFDSGPGNMLIDRAVWRYTEGQQTYDHDGALAAQGHVDEELLEEWLRHPYLRLPLPKTTGRELFGVTTAEIWYEQGLRRGLTGPDIIATLTEFTCRSIQQAYADYLPVWPDEVIVSGGGAKNKQLMAGLQRCLAPARVFTSQDFGMGVEVKEAVAFAVLAYETWHERPSNLPSTTGARRRVVLGDITPGEVWQPAARLAGSLTELRNPHTVEIDRLSTLEMVERINREDQRVAIAVRAELPIIARAIDAIAARMQQGGRLIYVGAGTSGRLGILDASECPPTFNTSPEQVIGLIAGGMQAVTGAVENAEDDAEAGAADLAGLEVGPLDCVVGIAASGATPYVIGALQEAQRRGALCISLACNRPSPIEQLAEMSIAPIVGPEVITGSTRMKAGTAQKMVLNMLSTGVMIRLGKTFGNLMVDVQQTNAKLRRRACRIVAEACSVQEERAERTLQACDGEVKTAIVSLLAGLDADAARARLQQADGMVRRALEGLSTQ